MIIQFLMVMERKNLLLDESDSVKVFTKLPRKFIVDTPIGTYNPDLKELRRQLFGKMRQVHQLYLVQDNFVADSGHQFTELPLDKPILFQKFLRISTESIYNSQGLWC